MDNYKMLQAMFVEATVGILVVNAQGEFIQTNPFSEKLFGYESGELIGKKIEVLLPQSFRNRHVSHRENYHQHPVPRTMGANLELYGLRKDGSQFPIEISLSHMDIDGERFSIAYASDDSVQQNMMKELNEGKLKILRHSDELEQKVVERTRELRESEARLKESQRTAKVGVWEFDISNQTITWSDQLYENFGLEQGIPISVDKIFSLIHPDDKAKMMKTVSEVQSSGIPQPVNYRIITPQGEVRFIHGNGEKIIDPDNPSAKKIRGILQDVTDLKEAELALKASEAKLTLALEKEKELGELKSRFVSMASHEFRTPLSSILSSANLIGRYTTTEQNDKRKKHVGRIESSVRNLTMILNDFLSLEKLESGKIRFHPVEVEINEYVQNVLDEVNLITKKDQKVVHHHKGNNNIVTDEHLLKNILLNLLSNGIKYSPEGKNVELHTQSENGKLNIQVKDYGFGIPEAEQQYMFSRFFRANNVTAIQGTGLGLTIVKRYLELMDGKIWFESEEGKGTTFFVEI